MPKREYKERISTFHDVEDKRLYPEYPLKGLHIELSNVCNHQCLFCANRKMTRKKGFIDESFLKSILQQAYNEGFREVGYYANGEPFVSSNLAEYIKWAKQIGFQYIYIDTNGGATDFEQIREAIDAGLDSIKFSINGTNVNNYKLIHGRSDFNKVLENLKKTYKYKTELSRSLNVYVSIAVTRFIEDSLEEFVEFCKRYSDEVVTNSVIEMGGYISEELKLLSTKKDTDFTKGMTIPCYMMWNGIFITYEGYATACCADFQNYFVYADLNKESIREAWHNDVITDLRRRHLEREIDNLPCVTCVYGKHTKWKPLLEEYATICSGNVLSGNDIRKRVELYNEEEKNRFIVNDSLKHD